ncbi:hypothetical protein GA0070604_2233 [Micromonospora eburnea]|uniref:Uncharacterized protein n=1 Tax=Micromonospora eburnea TaxID=227316 RepID=A0A1C6UAE9_9ACTN|nr:hypothetical protein GA0070604_2233 [Micromonospora eburnea]
MGRNAEIGVAAHLSSRPLHHGSTVVKPQITAYFPLFGTACMTVSVMLLFL